MSHQPTGPEARHRAHRSPAPGPGSAPPRSRSPPRRHRGRRTADPAPKRSALHRRRRSRRSRSPRRAFALPRPPRPRPNAQITDGVITRGHTLSEMLRADGVSPQTINQIAQALKGHFNFRRAKPGHSYRLVQDRGGERRSSSATTSRRPRASPSTRVGGALRVSSEDGELEARSTRIAGVITSTLYPVDHQPRRGRLARARLRRHLRLGRRLPAQGPPGRQLSDPLRAAVPRGRAAATTYVRPGRILAARFQGQSGEYTAVYFESRERPRRLLPARRIVGRGRSS